MTYPKFAYSRPIYSFGKIQSTFWSLPVQFNDPLWPKRNAISRIFRNGTLEFPIVKIWYIPDKVQPISQKRVQRDAVEVILRPIPYFLKNVQNTWDSAQFSGTLSAYRGGPLINARRVLGCDIYQAAVIVALFIRSFVIRRYQRLHVSRSDPGT
jgi:hypothetical protein